MIYATFDGRYDLAIGHELLFVDAGLRIVCCCASPNFKLVSSTPEPPFYY
jgi:hypothetical protein